MKTTDIASAIAPLQWAATGKLRAVAVLDGFEAR
jgi:hypothetical protein